MNLLEDILLGSLILVLGILIGGHYTSYLYEIDTYELELEYCNEKGYNYYKQLDSPEIIGEDYSDRIFTYDICYNNETSIYGIDSLKLDIWKDTRVINNFEVVKNGR